MDLKKIAKKSIAGLSIIGAFALGEYVQPIQKAKDGFREKYVSREDGFYKGKLELVKPINENKREEIYLVDKDKGVFFPVYKRGDLPTVNSTGDRIDYRLEKGWGEFKEDVKETYEGIEKKVGEWGQDTKEWWQEKFGKEEPTVADSTTTEKPGWFKRQYETIKEKICKD